MALTIESRSMLSRTAIVDSQLSAELKERVGSSWRRRCFMAGHEESPWKAQGAKVSHVKGVPSDNDWHERCGSVWFNTDGNRDDIGLLMDIPSGNDSHFANLENKNMAIERMDFPSGYVKLAIEHGNS